MTGGWGCPPTHPRWPPCPGMLGLGDLCPPPPRCSGVTLVPGGPRGPPASLPAGGQKVSFAGGIEERGEDLKSLMVSEIPEDPEGVEGDEEEAGGEQEDSGTGGTRGVSPPIPGSSGAGGPRA